MQKKPAPSRKELSIENEKLKLKLDELEETFRAIRHDEVDALIINTPMGDRIFSLKGADLAYRNLIEQMKEGAAMLSKNVQTVLYANPSLANMLGLPLEKVASYSIRDHIAPSHIKDFDELLAESRKRKNKISREINLVRSDGTLVPTLMSMNNLIVDGAEATYTVVTDLTEYMEKEVKEYTDKLEAEVKEKTEALRNNERMIAIGETAGMVGHDIRNPLQTIIGELFLAKDCLKQLQDGPVKDQFKETLEAIEDQATYMSKIIADLQDFARAITLEPEITDLEALIGEILRELHVPRNIKVTTKIQKKLPRLILDPAVTKRIIVNLVTNAMQAIPETGEITIQAAQRDGWATLSVSDTGVGIPADVKPKLFRPLFTTKAKGQGFGLAVVKRMVESMNGTITLETEVGKGTKFIIRFPLKETKQ